MSVTLYNKALSESGGKVPTASKIKTLAENFSSVPMKKNQNDKAGKKPNQNSKAGTKSPFEEAVGYIKKLRVVILRLVNDEDMDAQCQNVRELLEDIVQQLKA